jgi:hypothetical protein
MQRGVAPTARSQMTLSRHRPIRDFAVQRSPAMEYLSKIQNGPSRLSRIKGLQWQTVVRGDIGRQRLFRPLANRHNWHSGPQFRVDRNALISARGEL